MSLKSDLLKKLELIPDIVDRPFKIAGGSAIFYKNKEVAHFHHDNEIDVRLTKKIIRSAGLNHSDDSKFHKQRNPSSEWIEWKFTRSEHID
jgi:hypothetical protein